MQYADACLLFCCADDVGRRFNEAAVCDSDEAVYTLGKAVCTYEEAVYTSDEAVCTCDGAVYTSDEAVCTLEAGICA